MEKSVDIFNSIIWKSNKYKICDAVNKLLQNFLNLLNCLNYDNFAVTVNTQISDTENTV